VAAAARIPAPSAADAEAKSSAAAAKDAEYSSPASWWPTEGASPTSQSNILSNASTPASAPSAPAAARGGNEVPTPATGAALPRQGGTGLSVPDVQLLLAAPRDIDFLDPKVKSSKPTVSGQTDETP
jgi:hypothetical protein